MSCSVIWGHMRSKTGRLVGRPFMVIQVRDEEIWNETETVGITKSGLTSEMFEKEGLEDLDIGETWEWGGGRTEGYAQLSDPGEWLCGGMGEKKCSVWTSRWNSPEWGRTCGPRAQESLAEYVSCHVNSSEGMLVLNVNSSYLWKSGTVGDVMNPLEAFPSRSLPEGSQDRVLVPDLQSLWEPCMDHCIYLALDLLFCARMIPAMWVYGKLTWWFFS